MARPKKVSLHFKGKTWYARFYNESGERKFSSLQTDNERDAETFKNQIISLQINKDALCSDRVYEIFFGKKRTFIPKEIKSTNDPGYEIVRLQKKVEILEKEVERLKPFEDLCRAYENSEKKWLLNNYESCPSATESKEEFLKTISHLSRGSISEHKRIIEAFIKNAEDRNISAYTSSDIEKYLLDNSHDHKSPGARFNRLRVYLVKFFNWTSEKYSFLNPILKVKKLKETQKEDIHWHEIEEVIEVIENEEEVYWKRIIATYLYTGMSSHELRGVRKIDVDSKSIYVTPHNERTLKTNNRKRKINISSILKPYITAQMKTSGKYLFPPTIGHLELWHEDTLSRELNWRLKDDMSALSLRRTFGSLLLRSGKTSSEVAAVMGNSEEMIRRHYARLLSSEIDINFKKKE